MSRRSCTRDDRLARPDRVRRTLQKPTTRRSRISQRGGGSRASHLVHGAEDHDRLGDARQQGSRADRGALPVRGRVREDGRRRASDLRRPRPRPLPRRRRARTRGLPRHARADLLRAHVSRAARDAGSRARSQCASVARVRTSRPRAIPAPCRSRAKQARAEARIPARSTRRTRSPSRRSSTSASASSRSRSSSRMLSAASTGVPPAISRSSSKPMPRLGTWQREGWRPHEHKSRLPSSGSRSSSSSTRPATSSRRWRSGCARGSSTSASRRRS